MSVSRVHEPPLRAAEFAADPERFAFVRDGFYFWFSSRSRRSG